jgi:hypothetical protein
MRLVPLLQIVPNARAYPLRGRRGMDAENTVNGIVTGVVGTLIVGAALPFLVATPGIPV